MGVDVETISPGDGAEEHFQRKVRRVWYIIQICEELRCKTKTHPEQASYLKLADTHIGLCATDELYKDFLRQLEKKRQEF